MGGFMGVTLPEIKKCLRLLHFRFHRAFGVNEMLQPAELAALFPCLALQTPSRKVGCRHGRSVPSKHGYSVRAKLLNLCVKKTRQSTRLELRF
jgi:hypothetical protein